MEKDELKNISEKYHLSEDIIKSLDEKRFTCKRCSNCCRIEPGIVKLTIEDFDNIMNSLKMDQATFLSQCCREIYKNGKIFVGLKEKKNYDCIFWNNGCIIYEVRPLQCRTFPYWPQIVESDTEWKEEKNRCSGLDNEIDLTLTDKIEYYISEKKAVYKTWPK